MIVRKVDGQWAIWNGVNEPFKQVSTTATLSYGDGRQESIEVPPYEIDVVLSASAVAALFQPEKLASFGLARVVPFTVPDGKRRVGERRFEETETPGWVAEMFDVEDMPPPAPEPTREQKIAQLAGDYGLTVKDLREALADDAALAADDTVRAR